MNQTTLTLVAFLAACGPSGTTQTSSGPSSPSTMAAAPTEAAGATAMPETEVEPTPVQPEAASPDLAPWARILSTYVTDAGFRYAALHADETAKLDLAAAVAAVGNATGVSEWPRDSQLAFLINAYNILTVNAVIERWPIEGVMEVEGFFDAIEHQIAGESITLNTLENERIRGFGEPRIHFAVNCASASCPPLRATLFDAATLGAALEEQARAFVRQSTTVQGRRATLSKLFEWFADDFEAGGGVRDFIAARLDADDAEKVRNERTRLRYSEYDWSPNAVD